MDMKASKRLKVGMRVRFSDGVLGTVTEANWHAVKIAWDDGQIGIIDHDAMQDVVAVNGNPPRRDRDELRRALGNGFR